jgi:ribosomal protein L37E
LYIIDRVCARDSYFVQKRDACGFLGLSPHQKITSALRMLCYGVCGDATDEYCRTSESTATESLKRSCLAVRAEFEAHHLRRPSRDDFLKQLAVNANCGFPSMFASLDCTMKGKIVSWRGRGTLETGQARNPSSLRQWLILPFTSGMFSSVYQGLIMI